MKKNVVIIGAGPAGLTAGYELLLQKEKYNVIILEADKQVGGISKTISYKGNKMDIGGHRFFSKDEKVNDFWEEILPLQGKPSFDDKKLGRIKELSPTGPNPEKEDKVMLVRDRVSRIYYLKKFFDYPITMKKETFQNMGFLRTMQSGFSYLKSMIFKKKEDSLENFYINRFGKKLYSMFFEKYTEKLWGRHPKEISADWGAQRVKGLSIIAVFKDMFANVLKRNHKKETSLIEKYKYPKYGPGQLWETVAEKIEQNGGKIYLNSEVTKIHIEDNKVCSVEYKNKGKKITLEGNIFLSSMPIKDFI